MLRHVDGRGGNNCVYFWDPRSGGVDLKYVAVEHKDMSGFGIVAGDVNSRTEREQLLVDGTMGLARGSMGRRDSEGGGEDRGPEDGGDRGEFA
jgi:hypothetical protein